MGPGVHLTVAFDLITRNAGICHVRIQLEKLKLYDHMAYGSRVYIQGGPAEVKPTYIFAGNVWYLNV